MSFFQFLHRVERDALLGLVRLFVGGKAVFDKLPNEQAIYFSNHCSHLDTLMLLAALPPHERNRVRPVAGRDYWDATAFRRHIATKVLQVVFIDREKGGPEALVPLVMALKEGESLIVFPEGTRRPSGQPGPFKSGLYYLTRDLPHLALVPVFLENLHRAMPKGAPFPLPLLCRAHFGTPLRNDQQESKADFLSRAHAAVCSLSAF